ncbi:hypothetical protein Y032_0005g2486 [Ancylostoma ceylanicum]|nr:hypothetical protein Y032_0005g2486 [Ancylostoma ceylanicum]
MSHSATLLNEGHSREDHRKVTEDLKVRKFKISTATCMRLVLILGWNDVCTNTEFEKHCKAYELKKTRLNPN